MEVVLETERMVLRTFTESDVDDLAALNADPSVMRLLSGGKPIPRETTEREILPAILRDYDRVPGCGTWAAVEKASGLFLGWFELRASDDGTEAELGYRL